MHSPAARSHLDNYSFLLSLLFLSAGAYCAFIGLGLPNHPYQWAAGALFTFLAFQRGWFRWPQKAFFWALALVDLYVVSSITKLFIGSGRQFPFQWLRYPEFGVDRTGLVPTPQLLWQPYSFAGLEVDLTAVQTFLMGLVVLGRFLRLQGFTSWMAFLLLLASIPALLTFQWSWVFPALALMGLGLYFHSAQFNSLSLTTVTK